MNVVIDEIRVSNPWAPRVFHSFLTTVYTAGTDYHTVNVRALTKAGAKRKAFKIAGRVASEGDTIVLCAKDEDYLELLYPSLAEDRAEIAHK